MNSSEEGYEPLPGSAPNFRRDRPIFEINFNDYIGTVNGLFNFMEILGGATLSVLLTSSDSRRSRESKAQRFLCGSAYTFSFNGFYMLVASMLSGTSAVYLPVLFYYVLFQGMGAACYIISGIMVARQTHEVSLQVMVGLCTGGIHAFHFAYVCYKNYAESKENKWF
ncbi:hypothetical protein HPB49_024824 [Dermacentor silvarum]|uniref:Uncharacterized protein n=1 Tax=Dermacentor silvarum TaxID=543639 RepID=A0ACB8CIA7_DERSI|nr:uncharacterized protein LOC119458824 [Dermacentor silvarum]KAH7942523.1 hypothetical protein HPB49_024824 [Dermacentor silvarum]